MRARFEQPDPFDGSYDLSNPQSFNRYAYVQNDPVNFIDPTGLKESLNCSPDKWGPQCAGNMGTHHANPFFDFIQYVNSPDQDDFLQDFIDAGGFDGDAVGITTGQNPQKTEPTPQPNPNCLQNAVPGSPGIGRPFAFNPNNGLVGHDGAHALSPAGGGRVQSLAPLNGQVIYTNRQEGQGANALYLVDVRLANGDVARYKDLSGVSVRVGQNVGTGDIIGSVRPAGDPRNYVGLHLTLVNGANYAAYKSNVRAGQPSPVGFFIDPLGPKSPVNCPGVNLTR